MRINKPWKVHKWLPVVRAMRRMLKELYAHPECGFLGHTQFGLAFAQYWRSFDPLEAYTRSQDHEHWPAWVEFNRRCGRSRGDVGTWHEFYRVRAGEYEAIYSGMPAFGLGKIGQPVPATGRRESARGRLEAAARTTNGLEDAARIA